eukprot:12797021-Ditylum_brightwellii.AAC.1
MQQEMARQMTIISEIQSILSKSVQDIVNTGIHRMHAAAFQAATPSGAISLTPQPAVPVTQVTPNPKQGKSNPFNLASGYRSVEQSSAAVTAELSASPTRRWTDLSKICKK